MTAPSHLDLIRRYFDALEQGDVEVAMSAFAPNVVQIEHPNALKPTGDTRDLAGLRADAHRGAKLLRRQRYDIRSAVEQGEDLAIEVHWEGELAVALGTLAPGDRLVALSAMFFTFEAGKIVRQTNYDCFPAPPRA